MTPGGLQLALGAVSGDWSMYFISSAFEVCSPPVTCPWHPDEVHARSYLTEPRPARQQADAVPVRLIRCAGTWRRNASQLLDEGRQLVGGTAEDGEDDMTTFITLSRRKVLTQ